MIMHMSGRLLFEVTSRHDVRAGDDAWLVEALRSDDSSDAYVAEFRGPWARERAYEYAAWKNAGGGVGLPHHLHHQ